MTARMRPSSRQKTVRWIIVERKDGLERATWYYNSSVNAWSKFAPRATEYKTEGAAERKAFRLTVTNPLLTGCVLVKKRTRDLETR